MPATHTTAATFLDALEVGDDAATSTLEALVAEATGHSARWVAAWLTVKFAWSGQAADNGRRGDLHLGSDFLGRINGDAVELTDARYVDRPRRFRIRASW